MLRRNFIHLLLICLFAFAQITAAAHEINHFGQDTQHSEPNKQLANEQCAQCISLAHIAGGLQADTFEVQLLALSDSTYFFYQFKHSASDFTAYSARSPPSYA